MTTINFDALQAEDGVKVLLVPATIIETDGTGTSYDDFSAFASVYVTAQAGLREGWRRNDPSLTIIVEHSDDGLSWSTAASFTFGRNDTTGSALVSSPKVHMRARWTVANLSAWQIVSVTAAPTYLDSPSGSGNGSSFSGAMVTGMDETNTAPAGQFLTICPTVVYDTDGYVNNSDPTETALTAPFDGVYLVTWNVGLTSGGSGTYIQMWLANSGPDNNARTTFNIDNSDDPLWGSLQQVVRLHAGDQLFATIVYEGATEPVHAVIGVGEPFGGWSITKLGSYPT